MSYKKGDKVVLLTPESMQGLRGTIFSIGEKFNKKVLVIRLEFIYINHMNRKLEFIERAEEEVNLDKSSEECERLAREAEKAAQYIEAEEQINH